MTDVPQQKLRIIGWVDPERIVKAFRKTRKTATICSHAEQIEPAAAQSADQKLESRGPPQEVAEPPMPQAPETEHAPLQNHPKTNHLLHLCRRNLCLPKKSLNLRQADTVNHQQPPYIKPQPKDAGEVRPMYRHPQNYGYRYCYDNYEYGDSDDRWCSYPGSHRFRNEPPSPQPQQSPSVHVTHGYNTYKTSPYVTEYEYIRSLPRFSHYRRGLSYQ